MTKAEFVDVVSKKECRLHNKGRQVCELVFVEGLTASDAARRVGVHPVSANTMVRKFRCLIA